MPNRKGENADLTPKEEAFCQHYVASGELKKDAAIAAGYTEKSAPEAATRLLKKEKIRARIRELSDERFERLCIDKNRLIYEAYCIAKTSIEDVLDSAGFIKPLDEIPEEARRAIQSIEVDEIFAGRGAERTCIGHAKKLKMHDKKVALEFIAKMSGFLTQKVEHSGSLSLEQLIAAANPEPETEE